MVVGAMPRIHQILRLGVIGLAALLLRLGYLQVIRGGYYRRLADQNRLRVVPSPAPRGLILDRQGIALATNRISFRICAVPQELHARGEIFKRLAPMVDVQVAELEARYLKNRSTPFMPATLIRQASKPIALRVEEARLSLPGITVEPIITRHYPLQSAAAHLLGYLSQPDETTLPVLKSYGVQSQDLIGRAGLERDLDSYLRGKSGGALIEVDHRSRQVRMIGDREAQAGVSITLTLDAELQQAAERALSGHAGACVAIKPQTGEVLVLASAPAFDPEAFALQETQRIAAFMHDEERRPMMNRATQGLYAPGSIIKPLVALTALQQRVISPTSSLTCGGFLQIGDRKIHCWNRDGHGIVSVHEALMGSCNVFFLETGRRLGIERLRSGLQAAGFGRKTGWPLGDEAGQLPGGRKLSQGEVAMLGIGQGEILITPMQAAVVASAIANRGSLVEPWVVQAVGDHVVGRSHLTRLEWPDAAIATVIRGMTAVVNDPHGTGIRAHSDRISIAGKTGTAQTHIIGRTHGWFMGFCPIDNPQLAIAVVAEFGGSGGDLPAAVAHAVCEAAASAPVVAKRVD